MISTMQVAVMTAVYPSRVSYFTRIKIWNSFIMPSPLIGGGIKRWCCLTSVCLTSVAYIGLKSRTERPRKTKIGTELAHVTRESDTTFKVKRSWSPGRFTHRRVGASGSCSGGRGNVLAVGNCCYVAVCSAARGVSAPTGEERGGGISWRPPAYSLLEIAWFHTVTAIFV